MLNSNDIAEMNTTAHEAVKPVSNGRTSPVQRNRILMQEAAEMASTVSGMMTCAREMEVMFYRLNTFAPINSKHNPKLIELQNAWDEFKKLGWNPLSELAFFDRDAADSSPLL